MSADTTTAVPTASPFDAAHFSQALAEVVASAKNGGLRAAMAQRLKALLAEGRREAERRLLADRHGRACAEMLSRIQDETICLLFHFARTHLYLSENPSEAERMAIVATGGYGRGLLAPGSDIDLLFLLPYKQTAWGESVAEAILYCLWDMGLKVGVLTKRILMAELIDRSFIPADIRPANIQAE